MKSQQNQNPLEITILSKHVEDKLCDNLKFKHKVLPIIWFISTKTTDKRHVSELSL